MNNEPVTPVKSPWYRRKWLFVMLTTASILIAAILVVAGVTYLMWSTSGEKALSDAVQHALDTPGTYHLTSGKNDVVLKNDGKKQSMSGTANGIQFDLIVASQTIYIKSESPEKLINQITEVNKLSPNFTPVVNMITASLKGHWLGINISRLPQSGDAQKGVCLVNASNQLKTNKNAEKQIKSAYTQNRFIDITTANQSSDATTYHVSANSKGLTEFLDAFAATDFYKSLALQCSGLLDDVRKSKLEQAQAEITLAKSNNALKTMKLTGSSMGDVSLTADYGSVPTINIPSKDVITYDELTNNAAKILLKSAFRLQ